MARTCPDCGKKMRKIQVLEHRDSPQPGLLYTSVNADRVWPSDFPVLGRIEALMCKKCQRVLFYAVKREKGERIR